MTIPERFVAFRAFGDFIWPPVPEAATTGTVRGCIEVHHLLLPTGKQYAACIRWLPASIIPRKEKTEQDITGLVIPGDESWPAFVTPLTELQQIEQISLKDLEAVFVDNPSQELAYRCDAKPKGLGDARRLVFQGVSVLEQYAVPLPDAGEALAVCTSRLPLLHTYEHGNDQTNSTRHSTLQIGLQDNPGIRLDLAIALGAPQSLVQHTNRTAVFGFSSLYDATLLVKHLDGKALSFHTLTFGPAKSDSNLVDIAPGRIGEFDFYKFGTQAPGAAVCDAEHQWPTECSILEGTLRRMGFRYVAQTRPNPNLEAYAKLDGDTAPDLIRMPGVGLRNGPRQANGAIEYLVRQTFAIQSGSAWAKAIDESASDIRVVRETLSRPAHFQLRAPSGGDHWIDLARTIYMVLDIKGAMLPTSVWATAHRASFSARIGWAEPAEMLSTPHNPFQAAPPFHSGANAGELLSAAIAAMRLARVDLHHLTPGQPQSMLPELQPVFPPGVPNRHYGLFTCIGDLVLDHCTGLNLASSAERTLHASYRLSMQTPDIGVRTPHLTRQSMQAVWPSFFRQAARGDYADLALVHAAEVLVPRDLALPAPNPRFAVFTILDETAEPRPTLTGAIAGLWFQHSRRSSATGSAFSLLDTTDPAWSVLRFAPRAALATGLGRDRLVAAGNLELRLRFLIDTVSPIAVDIRQGDRSARSQPLLLRETPLTPDEENARYLLDIVETLDDDEGRRLTAQLSESRRNVPATIKTIMLSAEPFSVQRLLSSSLDSLGNPENTTVAKFDSDTGVWEMQRDERDYHYVLAPQSAGESMDKPRRLEIHDADASDTPLGELDEMHTAGFLSPVVPDGGSLRRRAVEFRLTPPAELWIAPSDVRRNYFAPQWASHEIFRQKSELGLGAALVALRAEFLYGMPVSVSPKAERGVARRARVAELEALTGRPPGKFNKPDSPLEARWERLRVAMARRPERLELWADDPDSDVQFAPARFSDGARFSLRTTALHRPPVPDAESGEPWPVQRRPASPRLHPLGLSGGALWPVESNNVLSMILDEPAYKNGTIERIALSPHGGDADQKARFCGGRVALISSTRAGFVQRQKVEVIGRIGVFWHRAKHVVVYERTVNPSAQFTPEGGLATRTRRPVLRKISEYIEILEPERRYPDMQDALAHTSSFLRGMRFNSRIIPVDSAWAEDVKDAGWQIPLWNRHAARQRPQVYPRPDTAFITAAEGPDADAETAQECLDPDNLYFFADTTGGKTDQTDTWPARRAVDFIDLPAPAPDNEQPGSANAPPRVPPGFSRFTWSLAPSSRRTAVNAGRATRHVYAALDTLTFMRASPTEAPAAHSGFTNLLAASRGTEVKTDPVWQGLWMRGATLPDMEGEPIAVFAQELASTITGLPVALPAGPAEVAALRQRFEAMSVQIGLLRQDTAGGKLAARVNSMSSSLASAFTSLPIDQLTNLEAGIGDYCDKLKNNVGAAVNAKRLSMTQELQAWHADTQAMLDTDVTVIKDALSSEAKLKDYLSAELQKFLLPVFADTVPEFGKLKRGIETARASLADVRVQIDGQLLAARKQLQKLADATDMSKPWSKARLQQFEDRLDEVFARGTARTVAIIGDGKQRLATQLDDLSQKVGAATALALDTLGTLVPPRDRLAALVDRLGANVRAHETQSAAMFSAVRKALDDALKHDAGLEDKIAAIQARVGELEAMLVRAKDWVHALADSLDNAGAVLSSEAQTAVAQLQELAGGTGSMLQALLDTLDTELDTLDVQLRTAIADSLGALRLNTGRQLAELLTRLADTATWVQALLADSASILDSAALRAAGHFEHAVETVDAAADRALSKVADAQSALAPEKLVGLIAATLLDNANSVQALASAVRGAAAADQQVQGWRAAAKTELARLVEVLALELDKAFELTGVALDALNGACGALSGGIARIRADLSAGAATLLGPMVERLDAYEKELNGQLDDAMKDAEKYVKLADTFRDFDRDIRAIGNELSSSVQQAQSYGERVADAIGKIGDGNIDSWPGNILRAYAAAGDAPVMPNLDYAKEKLTYYYGQLADVVDMTPVEAWFGRLGEGLAAMGINAPCSSITNWLQTMDLSKLDLDVGEVLKKFAGIDLEWLMKGAKFPKALPNAIKITHDFDKANQRAWLQIDVNVPLDERTTLFAVGPFNLDVVSALLTGRVKLEASAASEKVEQTGSATVEASFDAMVGGQSMVQLSDVKVRYDKSGSLQVDFDPKNIKLNPTFQNIQNVLGTIVGDEIGGLKVIKEGGIPVGVEHIFSMPPMSLMFGTSGVQNLQICNQFQLRAFPDFMIANRFSLAKPDRPFIFSVFIIGGTGWLTVDVEYRPFMDELMVLVEAGAGGSASLGFAFAGCTGSVAITLSMALTYRKVIGRPGGGLTVSLVVLIVGVVDVLCIANACLSVMLRLSYKPNGDIDATGTFRLTIKISRFFSVSAGGQARYQMTGGHAQTTTTSDASYQVHDKNIKKAQQLIGGQKG
jgi:hypothetical protein